MPSQEAFDHVDRVAAHAKQVQEGLIPLDSPTGFVKPEGADVVDSTVCPGGSAPTITLPKRPSNPSLSSRPPDYPYSESALSSPTDLRLD